MTATSIGCSTIQDRRSLYMGTSLLFCQRYKSARSPSATDCGQAVLVRQRKMRQMAIPGRMSLRASPGPPAGLAEGEQLVSNLLRVRQSRLSCSRASFPAGHSVGRAKPYSLQWSFAAPANRTHRWKPNGLVGSRSSARKPGTAPNRPKARCRHRQRIAAWQRNDLVWSGHVRKCAQIPLAETKSNKPG